MKKIAKCFIIILIWVVSHYIGGVKMKQNDRLDRSILRTIAALLLLAIAIFFIWLAFALGKVSANIILIFIVSFVGTTLFFLSIFLISPIFWIIIIGMLIEKISRKDFIYYRKKLRPFVKKSVEKYLW